MGLGGYTAVKALLKNKQFQGAMRDYAQRALYEIETGTSQGSRMARAVMGNNYAVQPTKGGVAKDIDIEALNKFAEPLRKSDSVIMLMNDFRDPIKTPIGDLKVDIDYMLNKAIGRDSGMRVNQIGFIKPTLEKPAYIVEKDGKFHFIRSFLDDEENVKKFLSVISDRDGNVKIVTSHILQDKNIKKIIEDGHIIEDFVSKNDTGRFTSGAGVRAESKTRYSN